jgi:signal transduction histidine kinase/CheY-like chemotaxis protein
VVFYRDAGEAFAPLRLFAWSVLAAGILGLLVAAVLLLRAAQEFTRRVDTLREGTQRLASGDYAHRVVDTRDDELAQLGESFNRMAEATRLAHLHLAESNAELEESNRRLREASKLKDEFLANTSHELRTPLNGVLGFLGLVNDGLCDSREEEHESVRQALECGQHLHVLIEDVLEVSRIEAGRLTLSMDSVPVAPVLERRIAEVAGGARERGLALQCEPLADPALTVHADPQRLHHVLRLLLDNAVKFTEHGSVTLTCTAPAGAGHALFEVRDTGIGIAPDRQAQVFERFVQGDGSATRKFGGTGLGLSLVRDLVGMMGGVVWLTSDGVGHGTTVAFTLPLGWPEHASGNSEQRGTTEDDGTSEPAPGPLALVVEDDPALTRWLCTVLHASGIRTETAASAERAWMMMRRLRPSIVLLDHALPAGPTARIRTGAQLSRHMAQHRATADIPIVLLSGHDPIALEGMGALPNTVEYMRKPVTGDALDQTVSRLLATQKPRS